MVSLRIDAWNAREEIFMKAVLLSVVALAIAAGAAPAEGRYTYRPVSVSFVPGFSTNGQEWKTVKSNLSVNLIGGSIGRVSGAELGGVFNTDEDDVYGYQGAGVFNIVGGVFGGVQQAGVFSIVRDNMIGYQGAGVFNIDGGGFGGVQQAGVFNVVEDEFTGAQMAGVINIVGGEFRGVQVAGIANVVDDGYVGPQLAGVVNVSDHGFFGAQVAGVVNIAGEQMYGLQLSGVVNAADEFNGAQIGLVNVTDKGHGLQLGLVNVADEMDFPIGLVSIIGNGMFHANVWATEFAPVNVGVKFGSQYIYNVFSLGYGPRSDADRLYAGIGIGGHVPIDRFFVDIDILNHGEYREGRWFKEGGADLLSSLRLIGGWQANDWLAVTAGPTLNLSFTDEDGEWGERVSTWPGFTLGLQLL
jgi:hypothetical protein